MNINTAIVISNKQECVSLVRWLLLPLAPALTAIVSIAIAVVLGSLWYLFILSVAGVVYWKAKPRPLREYDDRKEVSKERFDQLLEEVKSQE